jgi:hypothetical protein
VLVMKFASHLYSRSSSVVTRIFFDPSVAPGVATLTPEGAMPEEGHELMRGLKGLRLLPEFFNFCLPDIRVDLGVIIH